MPSWRVFIIGPMGDDAIIRDPNALNVTNHLDWLCEALARRLIVHGYQRADSDHQLSSGETVNAIRLSRQEDGQEDIIEVITPFQQRSPDPIPHKVFDAIDDCDLVIADLTGSRPAVVYELALAHALGIPTYLVSASEDEMFYLGEIEHLKVDFASPPAVDQVLAPCVDWWLSNRNTLEPGTNPYTTFYKGFPLTDISAAVALAFGYCGNFVIPALNEDARIHVVGETESQVFEIRGVIVIDPEDLTNTWRSVSQQVESQLLQANFDKLLRGDQEAVYLTTMSGKRTPFYIVSGWVIDIPRTIFTLMESPRINRLEDAVRGNERRASMSGVLVRRFLQNLGTYLRRAVGATNNLRIQGGTQAPLHIVKSTNVVAFLREQGIPSREP